MALRTTTALDDLPEALRDCHAALTTAHRLLGEPDRTGPRTGVIGRSAPESQEPWNAAAADVYFAIWHGAAALTNRLRAELGLTPLHDPPRGHDALDVLDNLAPAAPDHVVAFVVRRLTAWAARARALPAVDEAEPWAALPAVAGVIPACPYCHTLALRMRPGRGEVRCFFPGCTDPDGNRTRARMEPGRMTGEGRLVFTDGLTMGVGA